MFEKHCQICGIDVKKETAVKRFGKFFCNDIHAQEYLKKKKNTKKEWKRKRKNILADVVVVARTWLSNM